jgi:hypothetical protein
MEIDNMKSKMWTASMLIALLLVAAIPSVAATTATITQDSLAANSKELFDKMTNLAVAGDKEAWMSLVKKGILNGSIIWLNKNDKVYSEGCEGWFCAVVKIRLPGMTDIYYTNLENIKLD